MKFYIATNGADNGSGMEYHTKEDFLEEIGLMIDDCIANGGETFDCTVWSDASCFAAPEDDEDEDDDDDEDDGRLYA
jgi:hypothetical protein